MGFLPRRLRPAPPPDDVIHAAAERAESIAAMEASLSCAELAEATVGGALGRVLAKLGAALDGRERESQNNPEPPPESFERSIQGVGLDGQHVPA
jgi:hypothetical protein